MDVRKKAMEDLASKIQAQKKILTTLQSSHRWFVALLIKLFIVLEIIFGVWFWFHRQTVDVALKLQHASPIVLWPVLCWVFKRVIDGYYGMRVRREEAKQRDYFSQQTKMLEAIELDPVFQENMKLLKQFGKDVPTYHSQFEEKPAASGTQAQVRQRPPPPSTDGTIQSRSTATPQRQQQQKEEQRVASTIIRSGMIDSTATTPPTTPMKQHEYSQQVDRASTPVKTPATREYTQPVDRTSTPVSRTPSSARRDVHVKKEGGFVSWLVDSLVGEGIELSMPLDCGKCGTNNGLVSKEEAQKPFVCVKCQHVNVNGAVSQQLGGEKND
jgi:hypothetical protein